MPLVTRWGSEVRTVSPLEPGPEDPKPKALDSRPLPVTPSGEAYNRIPFFRNPAPLKRNFQHPLPPELPDPPLAGLDIASAQVIPAPANGLDIDDVGLAPPTNGLDIGGASVIPPSLGLDINNTAIIPDAPAAGLDVNDASVQPPVAGLDVTDASVQPPVAGLDINDAVSPTLNIEIVSSSEFADDPSTGSEGEIKYSSEDEFIYIHNGTEWHKTNGLVL